MNRNKKFSFLLIIEWILPWVVLLILALFTYAKFFKIPYIGFSMTNDIVRYYSDYIGPQSEIRSGDRIIRIGNINLASYLDDLDANLIKEFNQKESVEILIERHNQRYLVNWLIPGPTKESIFNRLIDIWWMAYVLWIAGTLTTFFHRPKDATWLRLITIYYLIAILLILSLGPSGWHIWHSAILLRSLIWIALPLFLHFHWDFPKNLHPIPKPIWLLLYLTGILLSLLEWFRIIPVDAYLISLYIIIAGSLLLLIAHYILQPDQRKKLGAFNDAIFVVAIPIVLIRLANLSGIHLPEYTVGGAFMAFPSIPGAYFLLSYWDQISYQRFKIIPYFKNFLWIILFCSGIIFLLAILDYFSEITIPSGIIGVLILFFSLTTTTLSLTPILLLPTLPKWTEDGIPLQGTMQFRANRSLSSLFFIFLVGFIFSLINLIGTYLFQDLSVSTVIAIVSAITVAIITIIWYPSLNRFIEKRIFKIDFPFHKILQSYVDNISTSLDRQNLAKMLTDKIIPSLLIRESVLISYNENRINVLFRLGISETRIPRSTKMIDHLKTSIGEQYYQNIRTDSYPWIRMVVPLQINQAHFGLWLFGRKDPDDFYFDQEIDILKSIANQTAVALAKIQHKERIDILLHENIHYAEEERRKLARDLHDEVLNGLVVLGMTLDDSAVSYKFETQFKHLTNRIRRMINGLRPPSLDQGLWFALQDKMEELRNYSDHSVSIIFDVPYSDARYPLNLEGHIYRIIQQACDNALLHSRAKNIYVKGLLNPDMITLRVEDDGKGFSINDDYDELRFDSENHSGLKFMKERAELIGADFSINSTPDYGTTIHLSLHNLLFEKNEYLARLKAESELIEREKSFRDFLANSSFAIVLFNRDLDITYANRQASLISGYSIPELLKQSVRNLTIEKEYQKIISIRRELREGKISERFIETLLQDKNGKLIPIQMTMTDTLWNGKNHGLIIFSDITSHKKIEIALEKSEQNMYKIFDNSLDGIALLDKRGYHIYVNDRYCQMIGYSKPELLGKAMETTVPEATIAQARKRLENRFIKESSPSPYEITLKKKDGILVPIIGVSTIIAWKGEEVLLALMRDISQQKEVEQALQNSEEKFKALVENAQECIFVLDEEGDIIYANQKVSDLVSFSSKELLQLSYREIVHPDCLDEIASAIKKSREGEENLILAEIKILTKSGKNITVEYSLAMTKWEGQRSFIIKFRDISLRDKLKKK